MQESVEDTTFRGVFYLHCTQISENILECEVTICLCLYSHKQAGIWSFCDSCL